MRIKWREPIDFRAVFAKFYNSLHFGGLKAKLVSIMVALSFTSAMLLFVLDSRGVKEVANAIQSQNEDLSQAFQISVDEITTQGFTNQARLQDFISTLNRKGVKEISILSNDRQILESSNPQKVGKVIQPKHKDFLITGALGDEEGEEGLKRKIYNLVIPVIVKGEQQGYINLKLHLEDIGQLLNSLRVRRLFAILIVFGLGVAGAVFLASRYTEPIGALVKAARRVAAGNLSQTIPTDSKSNDEIRELTRTFNEMIERLREHQVLQQKLARSEHLSRLGQLSAGIAHEVRNPLNYLSLSLDQLKDDVAKKQDSAKTKEAIVRMKQEVLRLSHLVKNFLSYGKPLKLNKTPIEAAVLIDDSLQMVNDRIIDQGIIIKRDIINEGLQIYGDREHLKSCVTNVLLNAVQAVSNGGTLEISAKKETSSVVIIVKDNGAGIDADKLKHIGEPFFTTKECGVGVGLAITKKILTEHDGSFEIASEGKKGTVVKMRVPAI